MSNTEIPITDDLEHLLRLNMIAGIGTITYRTLIEHFGTAKKILNTTKSKLESTPGIGPKIAEKIVNASKEVDVDKEIKLAEKNNVKIVPFSSKQYPPNLNAIYDPPMILYIKGNIEKKDTIAIAIVGSRKCSYYGQAQAAKLALQLAQVGFCVVSGMARGIDTSAHTGAMNGKGRTIAVLGCGLSTVYPRENRELMEKIASQGAVISELPMNTPPNSRNFPPRNRIISGLSLGVLVIESTLMSGSLITTRWALEQGKEVFAVPGNIDSNYSKGTNKLIKEGAKLVEDINDIIEEFGPLSEALHISDNKKVEDMRSLTLNSQENRIFSLLSSTPKNIDEITLKSGIPVSNVTSILLILEVRKLVKQLSGNRFVKT
ncbi:MAG: DNA-protecting protein DprA [Candidatus Scalindua sp. AMX11]|nr:MAG: DNA-protecting protein DprA [Candidatus Scalindua sp.]NOG83694.1 DNA-protecting protein DprA [Planctomycetota bacterium]RZV73856.1 MAG: DNA-protecting protein DprA [Candidatus Scalindua sp. SCAELEC01]TDE64863.1 MAG: DNA-protecting protein DprA [Candidatus Scalindua sp. AMX11]GJQ60645.1 MAG: DNA processing protein DprA [Candidatus Scalindua sp.]